MQSFQRTKFRFAVAFFAGFWLLSPRVSIANEADEIRVRLDEVQLKRGSRFPYCGIYAAARALNLNGLQVDPADYATTKYVSSPRGSSPADVIRMIEDSDCFATPFSGLSKIDLLSIADPIIANVRVSPSSREYSHWVCVTYDSNSGNLLVFDGALEGRITPIEEFLAVWNGYGVVVSSSNSSYVWSIVFLRLAVYTLLLLPVGMLIVFSDLGNASNWVRPFFVITTATIGLSFASQLFFGSIVNFESGVRQATLANRAPTWREVDLDTLIASSKNDSVLLIDARDERSFCFGSIPTAINIPFDSSVFGLKHVFEGIDRDLPIVVFCQSQSCGYDKTLARNLSSIGFAEISVSGPGYREFRKSRSKNE